jgi:hypothetical protein
VRRLETISTELVEKLRRAPPAKQRKATLAACEFALSYAQVDNPLVEESLASLRAYGGLSPNQKAELEALAARLDDQYLDLRSAAEEGRAGANDYLPVFEKSLAVSALAFAGAEDPFEASTEAMYEAAIATDKDEGLFAAVEAALK